MDVNKQPQNDEQAALEFQDLHTDFALFDHGFKQLSTCGQQYFIFSLIFRVHNYYKHVLTFFGFFCVCMH